MNYANKKHSFKIEQISQFFLKILFKYINIKDSLSVGFKNN